jgi:hypothetical protein
VAQAPPYAYISAQVSAAGTARIIEVMPLDDVSSGALAEAQERQAEARLSSATPEYELRVLDAAGTPLVSYAIRPEDRPHDEPEAPAGSILFADVVEFPPEAAAVRVTRAGNAIAERAVTANAPDVQLLSPNGGEQLSGEVEVRWQASDADNDPLRFTLFYSSDSGANWLPVAADLAGGSATLASTAGLAGSDRALFRVVASDGMRIAVDESDASFAVPNNVPSVYIAGPPDGAEL